MTATSMATGRVAHVDTAAISGKAARRAGLPVSWGAQIIQLNGGDRGEERREIIRRERAKKEEPGREEEEGRVHYKEKIEEGKMVKKAAKLMFDGGKRKKLAVTEQGYEQETQILSNNKVRAVRGANRTKIQAALWLQGEKKFFKAVKSNRVKGKNEEGTLKSAEGHRLRVLSSFPSSYLLCLRFHYDSLCLSTQPVIKLNTGPVL